MYKLNLPKRVEGISTDTLHRGSTLEFVRHYD